MNLRDCYIEEDLFPKIFAEFEERDYGILFYNTENKDSFDSNHAVIYRERVQNLQAVLSDIAEIDETFFPNDDIIMEMMKKDFFEETGEGRKLNSFVHFIMWNVLNADCVLHSWGSDDSICNIYFKSDVMILFSKMPDSDNYVFHFVPYIPQAIGGFSYYYKQLTDSVKGKNEEEIKEIISGIELNEVDDLLHVLRENGIQEAQKERLAFSLRGDIFDNTGFFGVLLKTYDGYLFVQAEDKVITYSGVDGYGMLKKISEWIIATHGSCISWGMKNE